MSKAVLNNSQATGHTDLLSGILKVQVRNEEKITEQDRIYCQNQQDELYKTLDQIAWWYNIFKREAEKYEGKIKLKHEPNGKITTSSYDLHYRYNNDEKDYTHHEFTPFKNINDLVDSRHNAIRNFISRIIGYFNNTYSVSVEAPKIDEKTLPIPLFAHLGDKPLGQKVGPHGGRLSPGSASSSGKDCPFNSIHISQPA